MTETKVEKGSVPYLRSLESVLKGIQRVDLVTFGLLGCRFGISNRQKRIFLNVGQGLTFDRILTGDLLSVHGRSNELE